MPEELPSDRSSLPSVRSELMQTSVVTVTEPPLIAAESALRCGEAWLEMVWLALTVTVPLLPVREVGVVELTRRSCIEECNECVGVDSNSVALATCSSPLVQVDVRMLSELG